MRDVVLMSLTIAEQFKLAGVFMVLLGIYSIVTGDVFGIVTKGLWTKTNEPRVAGAVLVFLGASLYAIASITHKKK